MTDDRQFWVAFNHIRGIGSVRFQKILAAFGSLEAAWSGTREGYLNAGLDERAVEAILSARGRISPADLFSKCKEKSLQVLIWGDPDYPQRLKELPTPPPVLYLRGTKTIQDEVAVALVGTRRPTPYGKEVAGWFAGVFAAHGITVISGLARGIDAEAHRAALEAGGRTMAVLGNGADVVYPPEHARLSERIAAAGALISDYPPGTPPDAANFPPRNRIIAGLALAVIVVEAGEESGALLTARYAADYGRDTYAVPGGILSPMSKGCNRLIRDGACPALTPEDVIDELNLECRYPEIQSRTILPDGPVEAKILSVIGPDPVHIDDLRAKLNLPVEAVSSALAMMELKGTIRSVGGMNFSSTRRPVAPESSEEKAEP